MALPRSRALRGFFFWRGRIAPTPRDKNLKLKSLIAAVLLALAGCASNTEKEQGGSGAYLDDAGITAEVKAMIFNQTGIKALNVTVTTENRVVQLTGTVKSRAEMQKVVEAARRVERVKSVKNELKVQP